jgi:DNA invertase Pin-like site-specific DNA recombinase
MEGGVIMRKFLQKGLGMGVAGKVRAVGYVRVSTDQQAQEGVSLEAQKVRIRAHCTSQDIELVEIVCDDGYSAKSLDRPGMKRALGMLAEKVVNAIVVVKLDRLTRSVKDLGFLCDTYFREGMPHSLLSVSDSIDTRSASGKLMLNVLMSVAQWEREAISERTQEAMDELKRRGVRMGTPPYGFQYTKEADEFGRRNMIPHPGEQANIARICEWHKQGLSVLGITKRLVAEGIAPRNERWERPTVYRILERAGLLKLPMRPQSATGHGSRDTRRGKSEPTRDKARATERAAELRDRGKSLRQIAERLQKERILPARSDHWHAASILDLLRQVGKTERGM